MLTDFQNYYTVKIKRKSVIILLQKIPSHVKCDFRQDHLQLFPEHKSKIIITINILNCDQSNYSSRIVFSYIPNEFGQTRNSAMQSADPENPILEPNTE